MRAKVVITVLLLAAGLAGIAVLVNQAPHPPDLVPTVSDPGPNQVPTSSAQPPSSTPEVLVPSGPSRADATNESVDEQIARLAKLAMNQDAASRDAILAQLRNPDKEIRSAALEAAIQLNDRSVVPTLTEIAAATDDPEEKAALLEAIDYINLPSLTEYLAERRAQGLTNAPPVTTNGIARPLSPRPDPSSRPSRPGP